MKGLSALAVALFLAVPITSFACPNCKDAVAVAEDGELDPLREARAYNRSVYFMVAMPYFLLGSMGVAGYRMCRSARRCGPPPS